MKSRILATAAIALALTLGLATPAFAEAYTGALSANSSAAGGTVTYSSDDTGEAPGTSGKYSLTTGSSSAYGTVIQTVSFVTHTVRVGAKSGLKFTVKIPDTAKPGSVYTLRVTAGKFSDHQTITVIGVPGGSVQSGVGVFILWIAIPVIIAALVLLFLALRRRRQSAA